MVRVGKSIVASLGALALAHGAPLAAQDGEAAMTYDLSAQDMAEFGEFMGSIFQAEPLTPEQEARVPLASEIVAQLLPEGFYARMMSEMMETTMKPILGMFSGPEFVVMSAVILENGSPELGPEETAELAALLDPAYATRGTAMVDAMTGAMGGMFTQMEPAMREGLSKAYAARFTEIQLGEIKAFFDTPPGGLYARESMAIATDPQFMSSMMGALPGMMAGMGNIEADIETAMADIPEPRTFDDLSASDRARASELLGITEAALETAMETAAAQKAAMDDPSEEDWNVEFDVDDWSRDEHATVDASESAIDSVE